MLDVAAVVAVVIWIGQGGTSGGVVNMIACS